MDTPLTRLWQKWPKMRMMMKKSAKIKHTACGLGLFSSQTSLIIACLTLVAPLSLEKELDLCQFDEPFGGR